MPNFKLEVEKEPDSRLSRLTKKWCEEIWKGKYGLIAQWDGKEAKNLEKLLAYSTSNFGAMRAEEKCLEAMKSYLNSTDTFVVDKKHPFSLLYTWRSKFFTPDTVKKTPIPVPKREEIRPSVHYTKESLTQKILDAMEHDKDYLNKTYRGIRYLNGTIPYTKMLKEIIEDLMPIELRRKIDRDMTDDSDYLGKNLKRVGASFSQTMPQEEEKEPDWNKT